MQSEKTKNLAEQVLRQIFECTRRYWNSDEVFSC